MDTDGALEVLGLEDALGLRETDGVVASPLGTVLGDSDTVGDKVGFPGSGDGLAVASLEGVCEGDSDAIDGTMEGLWLISSARVGLKVPSGVGAGVGSSLGISVGDSVGGSVGSPGSGVGLGVVSGGVGVSVGVFVGCPGDGVGTGVSDNVGVSVGVLVG